MKDAIAKGADPNLFAHAREGSENPEETAFHKFERPIWLAERNGHTEIVEYLRRLGVKARAWE